MGRNSGGIRQTGRERSSADEFVEYFAGTIRAVGRETRELYIKEKVTDKLKTMTNGMLLGVYEKAVADKLRNDYDIQQYKYGKGDISGGPMFNYDRGINDKKARRIMYRAILIEAGSELIRRNRKYQKILNKTNAKVGKKFNKDVDKGHEEWRKKMVRLGYFPK